MDKMKHHETRRGYTLIGVLGITVLAFLMLVSLASAIQTTPTITWSSPSDITYGTALSSTQLNAVATDPLTNAPVDGGFFYTPAAGTVLSAGTYTLKVEFMPSTYTENLPDDAVRYTLASKEVTINVLKATPTVTWNNPADIRHKTALGDIQLNAVASVPGTFVYTPSSGTILSKGAHTLKVDFTPTDTANYNSVSQTATINVLSNNGNGNNGNGNGHNPNK